MYDNRTVDIAGQTFHSKRAHVKRLKPFYETMLWKDERCTPFDPPSDNLLNQENLQNEDTLPRSDEATYNEDNNNK